MARLALRVWLLATLLLVPLVAAQDAPGAPEKASPWTLVVDPGTILNVTSLRGPGRVEVHGTLAVDPTLPEPAVLTDVTLIYLGPGPHELARVRVDVPAASPAIDLRGGTLSIASATFLGGGIAIRANGSALLRVADASFDNQTDAAIETMERAALDLRRATFRGPADGLRFASSGDLLVGASIFRVLGQQVRVAPPPDEAWTGRIANTSFSTSAPETPRGGLAVLATGNATLALTQNRFRNVQLGVLAVGTGLVVDSEGDAFLSNRVGVRVEDATVRLRAPVFANNTQDIQGDATLSYPALLAATPSPSDGAGSEADAPGGVPAAQLSDVGAGTRGAWYVGGALVGLLLLGVAPLLLRPQLARLRVRTLPRDVREGARARIAETLERASGLGADDIARRAGLGETLTETLLDEMADEGSVSVRRMGEGVPKYRLAPPRPPAGAAPPDTGTPLRPQEVRVLRDLLQHPGTAQSAIAQRLGLSRQALHYHVKKLEARGLLTKVTKGRETHCYAREEAEPLVASAPPDDTAEGSAPVAPPSDANRP